VSILDRGRAAAVRAMVDACVIRRRSDTTTDPLTGVPTPAYATLYTGQCRVQQNGATASRQDVGGDSVLLQPFVLSVPISVTGIEPGDEATMTTSRDPDLVGRVFIVRAVTHKTNLTARRLGVEERTA
jgi:hypothetical protein